MSSTLRQAGPPTGVLFMLVATGMWTGHDAASKWRRTWRVRGASWMLCCKRSEGTRSWGRQGLAVQALPRRWMGGVDV